MKTTKTVLMPIEVPLYNMCWGRDGSGSPVICQYFGYNEGGHPICELGLDWEGESMGLFYADDGNGVRKPTYCNTLNVV